MSKWLLQNLQGGIRSKLSVNTSRDEDSESSSTLGSNPYYSDICEDAVSVVQSTRTKSSPFYNTKSPKIVEKTGIVLKNHIAIPVPKKKSNTDAPSSSSSKSKPIIILDIVKALKHYAKRESIWRLSDDTHAGNSCINSTYMGYVSNTDITSPSMSFISPGILKEPSILMGHIEIRDTIGYWKRVFVVLEKGFLSIFEDTLALRPIQYPYGDKLIRRIILVNSQIMMSPSHRLTLIPSNSTTETITEWIKVQCPGSKIVVRPSPNITVEPISAIRHQDEIEVFSKLFNGFYFLVSGQGYINSRTKNVKWVKIPKPTKLTMWIKIICPKKKVPVRANPIITDLPIDFIKSEEEIEVYIRTTLGFYRLVDGRGYINSYTSGVNFKPILKPSNPTIYTTGNNLTLPFSSSSAGDCLYLQAIGTIRRNNLKRVDEMMSRPQDALNSSNSSSSSSRNIDNNNNNNNGLNDDDNIYNSNKTSTTTDTGNTGITNSNSPVVQTDMNPHISAIDWNTMINKHIYYANYMYLSSTMYQSMVNPIQPIMNNNGQYIQDDNSTIYSIDSMKSFTSSVTSSARR